MTDYYYFKRSLRNKPILVDGNGYEYYNEGKGEKRETWVCTKKPMCRARIKLSNCVLEEPKPEKSSQHVEEAHQQQQQEHQGMLALFRRNNIFFAEFFGIKMLEWMWSFEQKRKSANQMLGVFMPLPLICSYEQSLAFGVEDALGMLLQEGNNRQEKERAALMPITTMETRNILRDASLDYVDDLACLYRWMYEQGFTLFNLARTSNFFFHLTQTQWNAIGGYTRACQCNERLDGPQMVPNRVAHALCNVAVEAGWLPALLLVSQQPQQHENEEEAQMEQQQQCYCATGRVRSADKFMILLLEHIDIYSGDPAVNTAGSAAAQWIGEARHTRQCLQQELGLQHPYVGPAYNSGHGPNPFYNCMLGLDANTMCSYPRSGTHSFSHFLALNGLFDTKEELLSPDGVVLRCPANCLLFFNDLHAYVKNKFTCAQLDKVQWDKAYLVFCEGQYEGQRGSFLGKGNGQLIAGTSSYFGFKTKHFYELPAWRFPNYYGTNRQ